MTAYALHYRPSEVLIASDTLSYTAQEQPFGFYDKVVPLPRLRAAFFGRGFNIITANAIGRLALMVELTSFDDVADALPEVLREVTGQVADLHDIDDPDNMMLYEGYLVGWSEGERRMKLHQYNNYDDNYRRIDHTLTLGWTANPTLKPEFVPKIKIAGLSVERVAIEIMKAQQLSFSVPIGGEIFLTSVSPKGVSARSIYQFADARQQGIAAAAVRARVERGDLTFDYNADLTQVAEGEGQRAGQAAGASRAQRRRLAQMARKAQRRVA